MDDTFNSLMQTIDEHSFPYVSPKGEYQREVHRAEQHLEWLEEHLNEEEKAHFEGFRNAELSLSIMEYKASIKIALAVGIRLALPN